MPVHPVREDGGAWLAGARRAASGRDGERRALVAGAWRQPRSLLARAAGARRALGGQHRVQTLGARRARGGRVYCKWVAGAPDSCGGCTTDARRTRLKQEDDGEAGE